MITEALQQLRDMGDHGSLHVNFTMQQDGSVSAKYCAFVMGEGSGILLASSCHKNSLRAAMDEVAEKMGLVDDTPDVRDEVDALISGMEAYAEQREDAEIEKMETIPWRPLPLPYQVEAGNG
jgi:hypothetical protein